MKKNVVFWCAVNNPDHNDKYDSFKWFEYSKQSWKYWCDNNDVIFFEYSKPNLPDLIAHRVTWQRWFDVFDQLEAAGILGRFEGSKAREVLIKDMLSLEQFLNKPL